MITQNGNANTVSTIWPMLQDNIKDSFRYSETLNKLCSKGQGLSDKINKLKDIKVEVIEKTLQDDEKTFTLKIVGNLNLNNKNFIQEIAEQFASILEKYKIEKIGELSSNLDNTIQEMKNLFSSYGSIYACTNSSNFINCSSNAGILAEDVQKNNPNISWTVE